MELWTGNKPLYLKQFARLIDGPWKTINGVKTTLKKGKLYKKDGSSSKFGIHLNGSAMGLDESLSNPEAQSRAVFIRFGGEKGLKYIFPGFLIHSTAIILEF